MRMIKERNCPICNSANIKSVKKLTDYPAIVFPVDTNIVNNIDIKDLEVYSCKDCSHVYQVDMDQKFNEKLYGEYYKYYPYGEIECFVEHYREPFERIFSSYDIKKKSKRLLEIGVSSNEQLKFFNKHGYSSFGITPQATELDENIISSFYEEHDFNFKFDAIVSRFNLEHIVDLGNYFVKIMNDLNDNGLFIAQVPNTEYFIKEKILNFFAHEHTQYFNRKSIIRLFEEYGFLVEQVHSFESPSIIIVGRKALIQNIELDEYIESTIDIGNNIMNKIDNMLDGKVILYGASLSLTELLYRKDLKSNDNSKVLIVDDNPLISNMVMPLYDNEIVSYDKNLINPKDIIILVLNSVYHNKIIEKIRRDGLRNKVFAICKSGLEQV
jgi:hypothetical protein